ncbi:glycosyltransferase [Methylophilus aquaticus]|uniref:Glycosyltransferase n=1 Tax=Methylophilus aquaticus TaxID=1971610 RepID=A0ABT9JTF3_9PROT|nr:glycosyltransferase [Methylophilus aquaticus]MDP8567764.1 glycosyltransferase [Methylophilus aquaticus]
MKKIAYLAPEIPSFSATFVFNEVIAVRSAGFEVVCYSVHRPVIVQPELTSFFVETIYLYNRKLYWLSQALLFILSSPLSFLKGFRCLVSDVIFVGLNKQSMKLAFQFLMAAGLAKSLLEEGCAHLHIHFAHVPTQIGMYASALAGIPFSVMAHANDIFQRPLLLKQKAERSKVFCTISEYNRNYLISQGLDEKKIQIVRCGFAFSPVDAPALFGSKPQYTLGTLGRFVEKKGIDVLIKALYRLHTLHQGRFRLLIAGNGPDQSLLENLVDQYSLRGVVSFIGPLKHAEVSSWMAGIDAFVLACRIDSNGDMDGIPVVLMEAMSQNVPVISTRISGIPELVIDGITGLLADSANEIELAEKICTLFENPESLNHYVSQARKHVENEFSLKNNTDRLLAFIDA